MAFFTCSLFTITPFFSSCHEFTPTSTPTLTPIFKTLTMNFSLKNCSANMGNVIIGMPADTASRVEFHPQCVMNPRMDGPSSSSHFSTCEEKLIPRMTQMKGEFDASSPNPISFNWEGEIWQRLPKQAYMTDRGFIVSSQERNRAHTPYGSPQFLVLVHVPRLQLLETVDQIPPSKIMSLFDSVHNAHPLVGVFHCVFHKLTFAQFYVVRDTRNQERTRIRVGSLSLLQDMRDYVSETGNRLEHIPRNVELCRDVLRPRKRAGIHDAARLRVELRHDFLERFSEHVGGLEEVEDEIHGSEGIHVFAALGQPGLSAGKLDGD
nr:hypothetical protein KK1_010225 [Ipomoea batatas]